MNKRLTELIGIWATNGSSKQESFYWAKGRDNWSNAFPEESKFIFGLPDEIDRDYVRRVCDSKKYTIRQKFLAVMVWGYGDRGYGPYRVSQMLGQEQAETVLSETFEICRSGDPKGAYDFLSKNRIRTLGPSFGSKFITFSTPREIGAPIYDSYIAMWVKKYAASEFAEVPTSSENWNLNTYSFYWDWIKLHSIHFDCLPDEVELVLFRDAEKEFSKASSWAGK